jgi:hypothetical protein
MADDRGRTADGGWRMTEGGRQTAAGIARLSSTKGGNVATPMPKYSAYVKSSGRWIIFPSMPPTCSYLSTTLRCQGSAIYP